MRPICIDLFCGLGGWAEGFLAEDYTVIGFDIERHDYGTGGYPGQLVLQDVLTLHGSQFKNAAVIVASPPCQAYSYRAMPWKRAKALPPPDNKLFEACFRIQREASEAAGKYIPLIVENVKGAQPWVGRARANFGSFYLWGDVGRLGNRVIALNGRLGSDVGVRAYRATKNGGGSRFAVAHNTASGHSQNPDGRKGVPHKPSGHWTNPNENGVKCGDRCKDRKSGKWTTGWNVANAQAFRASEDGSKGNWRARDADGKRLCIGQRATSSKSDSRKAASAMIAKIPFPLSSHIAKCFRA